MGKKHETMHQVSYYECDLNGEMTFPMMISVAIKVSSEQSDILGVGSDYINTLGITWVITQTEVIIQQLPKVDQTIKIVTEPTAFNKFFCYRSFWIYNEAGEELVQINMAFALMDVKARKITSVSAELMAPFESEQIKKIHRWEKIEQVESETSRPYHVRYYDLDSNHHVNNAIYFNWLIDVLGREFMETYRPTYANLKFDKEVLYGVDIDSYYDLVEEEALRSRHAIRFGNQLACEANFLWEKR